MLGLLQQVQEQEDEEGFMERVTLAGLSGFQADAAPTDLYRLAQAVTQVRPDRTSGCVVPGTTVEIEGASYVEADEEIAQRLGRDAVNDAVLDRGAEAGLGAARRDRLRGHARSPGTGGRPAAW